MSEYIITIAVPVYNVEPYLKRCLNSLVSQDLEDCEILLVDDGSTDNSFEICKSYADVNERIRLIHQDNHGLAFVRNICIKESKGEYISFIDSDDMLVDGTYKHLKYLIDKYNADIISFGYINEYGFVPNDYKYKNSNEIITEFTTQEAIDSFFIDSRIDVITCNKIIKRALFEGILYPVGKLYEDMYTNYKIIAKASKIIATSNKYYVYCHRNNSIGASKFSEKTMELYDAASKVYEFGLNFCEKIENLEVGYLHWMIVVTNSMIRSNIYKYDYINMAIKYAKSIRRDILKNSCISSTRKIQMLIFSVSFDVYKTLYKYYIRFNREY